MRNAIGGFCIVFGLAVAISFGDTVTSDHEWIGFAICLVSLAIAGFGVMLYRLPLPRYLPVPIRVGQVVPYSPDNTGR